MAEIEVHLDPRQRAVATNRWAITATPITTKKSRSTTEAAAGTPGRGYLLKQTVTDIDAFAEAVRRVAAGVSIVDPAIERRVLNIPGTPDDHKRLLLERTSATINSGSECYVCGCGRIGVRREPVG